MHEKPASNVTEKKLSCELMAWRVNFSSAAPDVFEGLSLINVQLVQPVRISGIFAYIYIYIYIYTYVSTIYIYICIYHTSIFVYFNIFTYITYILHQDDNLPPGSFSRASISWQVPWLSLYCPWNHIRQRLGPDCWDLKPCAPLERRWVCRRTK